MIQVPLYLELRRVFCMEELRGKRRHLEACSGRNTFPAASVVERSPPTRGAWDAMKHIFTISSRTLLGFLRTVCRGLRTTQTQKVSFLSAYTRPRP